VNAARENIPVKKGTCVFRPKKYVGAKMIRKFRLEN
jgi:hypothetical protein